MTGGVCRLPAPAGLFVDRTKPVRLQFEGRSYDGFDGDTLASALAAHGRHMVSRSFKYHRPRGLLTMAGLDANTYVQAGPQPNAPADRLPVSAGLEARAQNVNGSLDRDRDAVLEALARFMPVGFYYKAFFRPKGVWKYWERLIRAKAGLGAVDLGDHHDYHDKAYLFADVAVIGGGPAGMAAAREAAEAGAEVVLIEEEPRLGGWLNWGRAEGGPDRAAEVAAELAGRGNVTVLTGATCTGWFADNWLSVTRGNRFYKLRARAVVAATGVVEQPMVFRNNDLPGVVMGSACQRLIRLYGVRPGHRAVVATANDHGYEVALDLAAAGTTVSAIVDLREAPADTAPRRAARDAGHHIVDGATVWEALPARGKQRVRAAVIDRIKGRGEVAGKPETLDCDLICMSVGYSPLGQLLCHSGGRMVYDPDLASLVVDSLPAGAQVAGSVAGTWDLEATLAEGRQAGYKAAGQAGLSLGDPPAAPTVQGPEKVNHDWPIFPHPKGKDFVDFDEDQTVKDVTNAVLDGFEDVELVKRYTTVGMGPSQGRTSALNAVRLVNHLNGRGLDGSVVTTQRPPFKPESFEHLAGRIFEPVRHTAMHHRHLEAGARMMLAGAWLRPAYYDRPERREAAIAAEARAVRQNVGLIDVSTLGGLEVRGTDAAEFLNRMYTFAYLKQPVGRSRYLLMTDPTGAIIDDGVACRFAEDHFYVTATTGGVDGVYRAMLRWNAEWRLDVDIANVTAAYAGVNIAGPQSRAVLETLDCDVDLSNDAFPYMGVRSGMLAGIPVRLLRVGFVGELGYEVHCPASYGEALWDTLMQAGAEAGIRPFGVEAQRLLRLEKGHIIVGQDTDGLTFPHEADMAWAIGRKKPFYIGKRPVDAQAARPLTRKLTGFRLDEGAPVPEECNLVIRDGQIAGRVTSAARSEACGGIIGLAYVHPDDAEPGRRFAIKLSDGHSIEAEATTIPFYDPDGRRQEV